MRTTVPLSRVASLSPPCRFGRDQALPARFNKHGQAPYFGGQLTASRKVAIARCRVAVRPRSRDPARNSQASGESNWQEDGIFHQISAQVWSLVGHRPSIHHRPPAFFPAGPTAEEVPAGPYRNAGASAKSEPGAEYPAERKQSINLAHGSLAIGSASSIIVHWPVISCKSSYSGHQPTCRKHLLSLRIYSPPLHPPSCPPYHRSPVAVLPVLSFCPILVAFAAKQPATSLAGRSSSSSPFSDLLPNRFSCSLCATCSTYRRVSNGGQPLSALFGRHISRFCRQKTAQLPQEIPILNADHTQRASASG